MKRMLSTKLEAAAPAAAYSGVRVSCVCARVSVYMCVCARVCVCADVVCMHLSMYVCVCVCVRVSCVCA